jgi:hypothetical protein
VPKHKSKLQKMGKNVLAFNLRLTMLSMEIILDLK